MRAHRRAEKDRIEWDQTFAREGGATDRSVEAFRCSPRGITPIAEGTIFTGVQYGNDLKSGATWNWTWAEEVFGGKTTLELLSRLPAPSLP